VNSDERGTLLPPGAELRVQVKTEALVKAVSVMQGAARDRSTALGPLMLRLAAETPEDSVPHLRVSVDTGEMEIATALEGVSVLDAGSVSVVLADFLAKLKSADSPKVEISVLDAGKIMLRTPRTRWEISGQVGFWDETQVEPLQWAVLEAADLAKAVSGVLPAVPKNSGRPALERVHIQDNWVVATNGALLLKRRLPGDLFTVDLPRPVAAIIATLKTGEVTVSENQKMVEFAYPKVVLRVAKPLLPFPDVSKIETAAVVEDHGLLIADVGLLLASLGRVRTYADPERPEVVLQSVKTKTGWAVVMYGEDRSGNVSKEALVASWQSDKVLNATFHWAHLQALLKAAGDGEVILKISTNGKSLLVEDDEKGLVAVAQQILG
jgi:hypothetical protein